MEAAAYNKAEIQAEMNCLTESGIGGYREAIQSYFAQYGLNHPAAKHRFGWFDSDKLKLAGHLWIPEPPGETVVALHGYLNHTGQLRHLIAALLKTGFAVGSFDLPGHGLSEGKEASAKTFEAYSRSLLDFVSAIKAEHRKPLHFIGFSAGAAAGIDLLLSKQTYPFEKTIWVCPLIHWRAYEWSRKAFVLYRFFTDKIPRMPQKNSSDRDFLLFNRRSDYLHCRSISLDWVGAFYDWNDKIEQMRGCDKEILILQGDGDTTVDWRYNIRLLRDKFPAGRVEMIRAAKHELFNETAGLREQCLAKITGYLTKEK